MAAMSDDPRRAPVGVFDSGVGGLTVLHELLVSLPREDFLYLGDSARFPYGTRTLEDLRSIALENAAHLRAAGAKLVVVACNSATAAALELLEDTLDVEVVGVISPAAQLAVDATHSGRIGLLATPATVASGAYERAVSTADRHAELTSVACPDLAPIIQGGFPFDARVVDTVRSYTVPLRDADVDTVILGSTHYPLVGPMLQRMLGRGVALISPGAAVARRVEHALARAGLASPAEEEGEYSFHCTGDVAAFTELGTRFLQLPLTRVERVELAHVPAALARQGGVP